MAAGWGSPKAVAPPCTFLSKETLRRKVAAPPAPAREGVPRESEGAHPGAGCLGSISSDKR